MIRTEHVLDTWNTIRTDTAQAVEDLPAGEFDFKPVPEVASFREIARHILNAGHAFTGMLLAGREDFTRNFRADLPKYFYELPEDADQAALAAALRESLRGRTVELSARPPEWWEGRVTRMDGQRLTRLEMLEWTKDHELDHRSQLFLYLRLKGIVPATTRRRQAQRQAAQ